METPPAPRATPRWAPWGLIALTLAAGLLRLPALTAEEPWFDEVFSLVLAAQELPELWRRAIADETNPPGFYLLLWGWLRLGAFDLAWARALPLLAGTLAVPAVALAARATGLGWPAALTAAALAAVSPLLLAMSSELRAYAPLALATALTLAAAARRRPVLAAGGGVALVLLHYFGALVVAALALGTLTAGRARWRDAARDALLASLPAAAMLGAWVMLVVRTAGGTVGENAAWIAPPGPRGLLSFGSQAIGTFGTPWGAVAVLAALVAALVVARRAPTRPGTSFALALALVPLGLVALATALTGRGLWVARYLIITLPGWWILVALLVERAPARARTPVAAALLAWAVLAGLHAERDRPRRTPWSLVTRALTAGAPRTLCANESYVALPLRYAATNQALPLTVLDLADCTAARAPDAIVLRPGTEASLETLVRGGAALGAPRDLGTTLPATRLVPLHWRTAR